MGDGTRFCNEISITPPLALEEMQSFGTFRTVYCVPADAGGAGALAPREGMNYHPHFIQEHLQAIVDRFPTHEFTGYVECRNMSEDHPPVARYCVRGRRVEMVTPTLVWPTEAPAASQEYDCLCHCSTVHPRSLDICTGTAEGLTVTHEYLPACLACWHAASAASGVQPIGGA